MRRFRREFGAEPQVQRVVPKPSSYTALFTGNTDDCFKLGVAVRGKMVRLFADFYSADIILASPLGLRTVIGAEGCGLWYIYKSQKLSSLCHICREKKRDFDFLSSVEVLVLDQADVFLMQNWEHVTVCLSLSLSATPSPSPPACAESPPPAAERGSWSGLLSCEAVGSE